jgi:hypothetical protein
MTKRALSAVAGFLSLCLPLSAQAQTQSKAGADMFSALNNSFLRPSLALSDGWPFSFSSAFNWIEMTSNFLPALDTAMPAKDSTRDTATERRGYSKDSSKEVVDVRRSNLLDYVSGEVGFLYGRSSGKYGVQVEQGYIIGEVGDDKFHITVGAAYENSTRRR